MLQAWNQEQCLHTCAHIPENLDACTHVVLPMLTRCAASRPPMRSKWISVHGPHGPWSPISQKLSCAHATEKRQHTRSNNMERQRIQQQCIAGDAGVGPARRRDCQCNKSHKRRQHCLDHKLSDNNRQWGSAAVRRVTGWVLHDAFCACLARVSEHLLDCCCAMFW